MNNSRLGKTRSVNTLGKQTNSPKPITGADDTSSSCPKCNKLVRTNCIQCDACKCWYHRICGKLAIKIFNLYKENGELPWFCPMCLAKLSECLKQATKADEPSAPMTTAKIDSKAPIGGKFHPLVNSANHSEHSELEEEGTVTPPVPPLLKIFPEAAKQNVLRNPKRRVTQKGRTHPPGHQVRSSTLESPNRMLTISNGDNREKCDLAQLRDEHKALWKAVRQIQVDIHAALGRHRNVIIYGIPEEFISERSKRLCNLKHHAMNIFRLTGIPPHATIKRLFRLGKWRGQDSAPATPRPVLVEFQNPLYRDKLIAASEMLKTQTKGALSIAPDLAPKTGTQIRVSPISQQRTPNPTPEVRLHRIHDDITSPGTAQHTVAQTSSVAVNERSNRADAHPTLTEQNPKNAESPRV